MERQRDVLIVGEVAPCEFRQGGLYVATSIKRLHGRVGWGAVQQRCLLAAAAGLALLAVAPGLFGRPAVALVLASMLVATVGFAVYLGNAVFASLIRIAAPGETAGAVLTAYRMVPMLAIPFGQQLFGLLADRSSIPVALGVFSAVLVIGLVIGRASGLRTALDAIEPIAA